MTMNNFNNGINLNTSNVAVGINEIVTKYSIERNLIKLLDNDKTLASHLYYDRDIRTYSNNTVYDMGDLVFFKPSDNSTNIYLFKSLVDNNDVSPSISSAYDYVFAYSDDNWELVGVPNNPEYEDKTNQVNWYDKANLYVSKSSKELKETHEDNLEYHAIGKFSQNDSNALFSNLDNIDQDRKRFLYPYRLRSMTKDNVVQRGFMRQWQDGVVEYDIIFKLGKVGEKTRYVTDVDIFGNVIQKSVPYDIIEANNLKLLDRNYNFLYFNYKSNDDTFSQMYREDGETIILNEMEQNNVVNGMNVYYADIQFPIPFRDLNYMIFNSDMKLIKNHIASSKYIPLTNVDGRLTVENKSIVGHLEDSQAEDTSYYINPVIIPNEINAIRDYALCAIQPNTGNTPVNIIIDPVNSNISYIGDYAFSLTRLQSIELPLSTKHIGKYAFSGCEQLTSITFHIDSSTSYPRLGKHIFEDCKNLLSIYIVDHYSNEPDGQLFGSRALESYSSLSISYIPLIDRLTSNEFYKNIYSVPRNVWVEQCSYMPNNNSSSEENNTQIDVLDIEFEDFSYGVVENENDINTEEKVENAIEIDIDSFLNTIKTAKYASQKTRMMRNFSSSIEMPFEYSYDWDNGTAIISKISPNLAISENKLTIPSECVDETSRIYKIVGLNCSELSGNQDIYEISFPKTLTALYDNQLSGCNNLSAINLSNIKYFGANNFAFTQLNEVSTGNIVVSVDNYAFAHSNLSNIQLKKVGYIGNMLFDGGNRLKNIGISSSSTYNYELSEKSFGFIEKLKECSIKGANLIGSKTFDSLMSLNSLTIDMENCFIEDEAFYNCPNLNAVTLLNYEKAVLSTVHVVKSDDELNERNNATTFAIVANVVEDEQVISGLSEKAFTDINDLSISFYGLDDDSVVNYDSVITTNDIVIPKFKATVDSLLITSDTTTPPSIIGVKNWTQMTGSVEIQLDKEYDIETGAFLYPITSALDDQYKNINRIKFNGDIGTINDYAFGLTSNGESMDNLINCDLNIIFDNVNIIKSNAFCGCITNTSFELTSLFNSGGRINHGGTIAETKNSFANEITLYSNVSVDFDVVQTNVHIDIQPLCAYMRVDDGDWWHSDCYIPNSKKTYETGTTIETVTYYNDNSSSKNIITINDTTTFAFSSTEGKKIKLITLSCNKPIVSSNDKMSAPNGVWNNGNTTGANFRGANAVRNIFDIISINYSNNTNVVNDVQYEYNLKFLGGIGTIQSNAFNNVKTLFINDFETMGRNAINICESYISSQNVTENLVHFGDCQSLETIDEPIINTSTSYLNITKDRKVAVFGFTTNVNGLLFGDTTSPIQLANLSRVYELNKKFNENNASDINNGLPSDIFVLKTGDTYRKLSPDEIQFKFNNIIVNDNTTVASKIGNSNFVDISKVTILNVLTVAYQA